MRLGVALPIVDIGGEPAALREFAQAAEEIGYHGIAAPDHVLGANVASRPGWTQPRARSTDFYHDPFVLFGVLAGCTNIGDFSTQVLILAQRQTVLVAKASLSRRVVTIVPRRRLAPSNPAARISRQCVCARASPRLPGARHAPAAHHRSRVIQHGSSGSASAAPHRRRHEQTPVGAATHESQPPTRRARAPSRQPETPPGARS
jgi:hypothetical protein